MELDSAWMSGSLRSTGGISGETPQKAIAFPAPFLLVSVGFSGSQKSEETYFSRIAHTAHWFEEALYL